MDNNNCKEEISFEDIFLQSEGERYNYPAIFTDDCGLDIKFPEKQIHAIKSWGYNSDNKRRRATLKISSFVGMCSDAIHWYGKIEIQGVEMKFDNMAGSTFSFDKNFPLSHFTYGLTLRRPLTKHEIYSDKNRWSYYFEGDLTRSFNSVEEIIELAKKVFNRRFSGLWEFYVESPFDKYNGKLKI